MASRKKFLRHLFLCSLPLLLSSGLAAAVPVESSHYNSNTYTNLNALTSTGPITFTIAYNISGDIRWYKDNVLVQTDASCAAASLTAAWTSSDYGKTKQVKVNSTNGDGTSADTVWNVEVQQTGTATISKNTAYPQPQIDGKNTLYITNGWTNLPSLYLAGRQEDDSWIEYVEEKTYLLKANVRIYGATLYISTDTARTVRMQGRSDSQSTYRTALRVSGNGTILIDGVNFYGWDVTNNREITRGDVSPVIASDNSNQMDIRNSNFRHIYVNYSVDRSTGDVIENNVFYEGNPINVSMGGIAGGSRGQVFSSNTFYYGYSVNFEGDGNHNWDAGGTVLKNNRFFALPGGTWNIKIGQGTTFVGNEINYSNWNLIEISSHTLAKNNNLDQNNGWHNGYNIILSAIDMYFAGEYWHDFHNYSCLYTQTGPGREGFPNHIYIFNSYAKDSTNGINFCGAWDSYIYNYTSENANNSATIGGDHVVYRKSLLSAPDHGVSWNDAMAADGVTCFPMGRLHVIDSEFSCTNRRDYLVNSESRYGNNPVINSINSFRRNPDKSIALPLAVVYGDVSYNGEVRNYAYLDVLAQDSAGAPVSGATVTVEPLTDANYPAINILLPPPPPDLEEYPAENLPIPDTGTFVSAVTGADGHTAKPNYGWSINMEPAPALLFCLERSGNRKTTGYQYRITASWNSKSVSKVVTPDVSWLREDPVQPAKTVVLTFDKQAGKYALNVNGGTGSGLYDQGQSVSIAAGAAPSGKVFDKWIGDTTTVNDVNSVSTYVIVPSSDASINAYYKDITYHLTVVNGEGSGDYPAGRMAVADATVDNGNLKFDRWTGDTASVLHPAVYSSALVMPARDITVTAAYKDISNETYHLAIGNGTGSGDYHKGDQVTIVANPREGYRFTGWFGTIDNAATYKTSPAVITMPAQDIALSAQYVADNSYHVLTVIGGSGSGSYAEGAQVSVTADAATSGKVFDKWTGDISCISCISSATTTVTMPAKAMTLTATYRALGILRNSSWNYPNPVDFTKTDKTTITYTVADECNVYICLYTLSGDLAKVLVDNKTQAPGKYYIDWYGDNDGGDKAASGVYLYVAKIGKGVIRKKIVILR